jgi:hypothetical protein
LPFSGSSFGLTALGLFLVALLLLETTRDRRFDSGLYSDEPEWIAISILHLRQLALGEPPAGLERQPPEERSGDPWRQGVQDTTFGYMNPGLPKLLLGGILFAAGHRSASPLVFQRLQGGASREEVERAKAALLPAMPLARRIVLALTALSGALLALAAREVVGGRWGWLAAALALALWVASPLVRFTAAYIRTDYFMLPFTLGAMLLVLRARVALSGRRGARPLLVASLGLGLLCGLAVASKLNGGLACAALALALPILWWRAGDERRVSFARGPLAGLALAGITAATVFYALNPVLWRDPLGGLRDMLQRWSDLMAYFQDDWAPRTGVEVARTPLERLALFFDRTLGRDEPWHGLTGLPGGVVLLLAGLAELSMVALRAPPFHGAAPGERDAALVALLFGAVLIAGTALWLPLDWERFYLPAAPAVVLLEACAIALAARAIFGRNARPIGPSVGKST